MIIRSILKNLNGKKIDVYVRDIGDHSRFQGVLIDMTEEIILVKLRYNKIMYIPLSEIVVVTEHEAKAEFLKEKLRDIEIISSGSQH